MRKIYTILFASAMSVTSLFTFAQGKLQKTTDPGVFSIESSRKTAAPFSVSFRESSGYTGKNIQDVFTKYLGLRNGTDELRLKNHDISGGTIIIDRFQQYFKGIKVEHGDYIATIKNDQLLFITGDFYAIEAATSITPGISEDAARIKAWQYMDGAVPADDDHATGELVFVENGVKDGELNGKVYLAYKFLISSRTKSLTMEDVYVDASNGTILFTNLKIMAGCYKKDRNKLIKTIDQKQPSFPANLTPDFFSVVAPGAATIYSGNVTNMVTRLVGGSYRLEGLLATEGYPTHTRNVNHALVADFTTVAEYNAAIAASTEVTDVDNNWTAAEFANANRDNTALDVHWGSQRVYDYWKNRHNRLSWNGTNGIINCFVHADVNFDNAFWQGGGGINSMFYGDGSNVNGGFSSLTCLDVTGHELGHGVCQATANLAYNRESGGLNEGFSDIWGAAIEHYADPFETDAVAKSYFDIGEEIGLPYPSNPLRSMSDPKRFFQPDTYLGTYWQIATVAGCPTPSDANDQCGVHTNSGVLNRWFYLLVSGGTGTNDIGSAFAVPALGWTDAELIAFLGERNLTSTATYAACRTAMINAATTLFGGCSRQTEAVVRAWYAVGVGADFIPCTPQVSFAGSAISFSETSAVGINCSKGRNVTIPLKISSAGTGGNAVVTITVTGGTAINGNGGTLDDYMLASNTATFTAGDASNKTITLFINDDENIEANETIELTISSITQNGSNATLGNIFQTCILTITDDDPVPDLGGTEIHIAGTNTTALNNTSPFHSISRSARTQYIIPAADLIAAGLRPNVAINQMSVNVTSKLSTQAFTGYTISLANTTATNVTSAYVTGLTQVFNGNVTTVAGLNNFTLSPATFTWDGTSNLAVQVCFANASAGTANDATEGYTGTLAGSTIWVGANNATGCALAFSATNNTSFTPVYRFRQVIAPTVIETNTSAFAGGSVANQANNDLAIFTAAPEKLIARVKNNTQPLGCVTTTTRLMTPAPTPGWSGGFATAKGINVGFTTNSGTSGYNITLYYTPSELLGRAPSALKIYKTTGTTYSDATASNTISAATTFVTSSDGSWHGFSANFAQLNAAGGSSNAVFFLADASIVLPLSLIDVNVQRSGNTAKLNWKVEQQSNVNKYVTERSADGVTFSPIGNVPANNFVNSAYSFIDPQPYPGMNYYRIKVVQNDGSFKYSPLVTINFDSKESLLVTPNPVTDNFNIRYTSTVGIRNIIISDVNGKKLKEYFPGSNTGSILVDASMYPAGVYIVRMMDKNNKITTQKMIRQ